jgi:hypothetical protein
MNDLPLRTQERNQNESQRSRSRKQAIHGLRPSPRSHRRRVAALLLTAPALLLAAPAVRGADAPATLTPKILTAPIAPSPTLGTRVVAKPDLAIRGITVDGSCHIAVTVINNGPGSVPDAVWTTKTPSSSSVYLTVNSKGWGGATIWSFDVAKRLQSPGGSATYVSSYVVKGSTSVQATVDHTAQVAESNEGNNNAAATLNCGVLTIAPGALKLPGVATPGAATSGPTTAPDAGESSGTYAEPPPAATPSPAMQPLPVAPGGSLLQGQLPPPPQDLPPPPPKEDKTVEPGELVVVSANMNEAQALAVQMQGIGLGVKRRTNLSGLGFVVTVLRVPREVSVGNALVALRQAAPGAWADANHRYQLQGEAAVLYGRKLVGLEKISPSCGAGVRVGMVDTPVDTAHPALRGRDVALRSLLPTGVPPADANHGTATAALLVANPQPSGFGGLVPAAKLYSAQVFRKHDERGGETTAEWVVHALDWLIAQKVQVINLGLGGPRNLLVEAAVERVHALGIAVVAAAGNSGPDAPPVYPAAQKGVIAVTAVDANLRPWKKANRGNYVSYAAPGVDVWTATPGKDGAYLTGTSYASPFVTAALAAAWQSNGRGNMASVEQAMQAAARDLGDKGKDATFGWGLIQMPGSCRADGR